MLVIRTLSGIVRAEPTAPDETGSVLYELTGAVRGTVHVCPTYRPHQWDDFRALRVSLGSANALYELPAEPLPRIRGRAFGGCLVRDLEHPADGPEGWREPWALRDMEDRDATPRMSETLRAVMRGCGADYEARSDLDDMLRLARRVETPRLLALLAPMIAEAESEVCRYEREAQQVRVEGRRCLQGWWLLARMGSGCPSPLLALLLSSQRGGLAHRSAWLPRWAEDLDRFAVKARRVLGHFLSEREGLTSRAVSPGRAPETCSR
ncbi:hypothetical protein [Streptomyces sp. NPDC090053]|uniref:hypothetical protein n=1 Tax=Streptomyces sp. NPDC090053 TaxID=3365932 RepID=UPI00381667C0